MKWYIWEFLISLITRTILFFAKSISSYSVIIFGGKFITFIYDLLCPDSWWTGSQIPRRFWSIFINIDKLLYFWQQPSKTMRKPRRHVFQKRAERTSKSPYNYYQAHGVFTSKMRTTSVSGHKLEKYGGMCAKFWDPCSWNEIKEYDAITSLNIPSGWMAQNF